MISISEFLSKSLSEQEKILTDLQNKIQSYKDKEHGLYKYGGGCRCEICKKAKSDSMKKYLKNIKAKKALEQENNG